MIGITPLTFVLLIIGICATFGPAGSILYGLIPFFVALLNEILRAVVVAKAPDEQSASRT